jgi:hypothetical protein
MSIRILEFKTEYNAEGKATDWVRLASRSAITETGAETHATWLRVDRIRPIAGDSDKANFFRARWADIEPAYLAWKEGNEIPETGVPLAAWAGVTAEQAEVFKRFGLRTVEDVAEVSEGLVQRIPLPNVRGMREAAAGFLKSRDATKAADEIAALKSQLAEAMEMAGEAKAMADKPKRGRPRKESEAA